MADPGQGESQRGLSLDGESDAICAVEIIALVREEFADVGGVKLRFQKEGIVTLCGMDCDVYRVDPGVFEVLDEVCLFFRVKAEIGIDGKDEKAMTGFAGALKKFAGGFRVTFEDGLFELADLCAPRASRPPQPLAARAKTAL